MGFQSSMGQFITAESFGDQITCQGQKFTSKQMFTLTTSDDKTFSIRAHTGKYLSTRDKDVSVVTCDADEAGKTEQFTFAYSDGCVSIQNHAGNYLNSDNGKLVIKSEAELFALEHGLFPQLVLRNQQHFIGLDKEANTSLNAIPWGKQVVFTCAHAEKRGAYTLTAFNGKFLTVGEGGNLQATAEEETAECQFEFRFEKGFNSILCSNGKYVSVGNSNLKAKAAKVTKFETFEIQVSQPHISLKAFQGKYISVAGANVLCNKGEVDITDGSCEEFRLVPSDGKFGFQLPDETYLTSGNKSVFEVGGKDFGDSEKFELTYDAGKIALKTNEGKYVGAQKLGGLHSKADAIGAEQAFRLYLENRSYLVLKTYEGTYLKTNSGGKIGCNAPRPEIFEVQYNETDLTYQLVNTKQLKFEVGPDHGRVIGSENGQPFYLEITPSGLLSIKTLDGNYLFVDKNQGLLVLGGSELNKTNQFEW